MALSFVSVQVEEHEAIPDGCSLRFRATGDGRPVRVVAYESEDGVSGSWEVRAANADGTEGDAVAYPVDDSSAGTSILIVGGDHGLRLRSQSTGATIAEAYLLLAPSAVVG